MADKNLLIPACLSALIYLSGCSAVGGDVQAGRNALQTGHADAAIGYLMRAADAEPNYKTPHRIPEGVLTFLGRAYLETGKNSEARQTLEKAVSLDKNDPLARLYLGVALLRTGQSERGRMEVEVGLKGIDATLERIAGDHVFGFFWDPGMQIRNDIRKTLADKPNDEALASAGLRIGAQVDEEIDNARRDESRTRGGGSGGGGS
jgi:tetratricopeptide (TPR) repeat protein